MKNLLRLSLVALLLAWGHIPAHAIPAFARKYRTTCARCHTAFPKLNAYGESFKLRGYQTLGEKDIGVIDTRDEKLSLLEELPLAIAIHGSTQLKENSAVDFQTPAGISLLTGGTISQDVGFMGQYSPGHGLEKFSLVLANLTKDEDEPTALNAIIGKFELMDFAISGHRALTQQGYAIYGTEVGGWSLGGQERGIMLYGTVGSGIGVETPAEETAEVQGEAATTTEEELKELEAELEGVDETSSAVNTPEAVAATVIIDVLVKKGILTAEEADSVRQEVGTALASAAPAAVPEEEGLAPEEEEFSVPLTRTSYDTRKGWMWQVAVVNGNVDGESGGGGHAHGASLQIDDNNFKDLFGRLAYYHDNNHVGAFAYRGKSKVTSGFGTFDNGFNLVGADFSLQWGQEVSVAGVGNRRYNLFGAWIWRNDDNPLGLNITPQVEHQGGFLELDYLIDDSSYGVLRYDVVDSSDLPSIERKLLTANYTRYLRRNFKVGLELTLDLRSPETQGDSVSLVLDTVF